MRGLVALCALLAAVGGGWWYFFGLGPPTRKERDRLYAEICTEVARGALLRPSSLEVTSSIVTPPESVPAKAYKGHGEWAGAKPHRVEAVIEFSGQNRGGGFSPGAAICEFMEAHPEGEATGPAQLASARVNGKDYSPGTKEWLLANRPVRVSLLGEVEVK